MAKRRGRPGRLPETGLYLRYGTRCYWWRGWCSIEAKIVRRSTACTDIPSALLKAQQFDEELRARALGRPVFEDAGNQLAPHLEAFIGSLEISEARRERLRLDLERACVELELKCLADLMHTSRLRRQVRVLRQKARYSAYSLRHSFQEPLKRLSRWLYEEEIIERDSLDRWPNLKIKSEQRTRSRRAMRPDELVRALHAADALHRVNKGRSQHSLRPIWLALVVTAPRITALSTLDVGDLDLDRRRLCFAEGMGNKNRGAGCLDPATAAELGAYAADRAEGPLFLSPRGQRLEKAGVLKDWRACFSLAQVDLLWPADQPRDFKLAYLVHLSLHGGKVVHRLGGGRAPGPAKLAQQEERRQAVEALVARLQPKWEAAIQGVDVHSFRMTARTWCLQEQVPEMFIDLQLGHASERNKAALSAFWSMTGAKHYTDTDLLSGNASQAADAIRRVIDRAQAEFAGLPPGATIFPPSRTGATSVA